MEVNYVPNEWRNSLILLREALKLSAFIIETQYLQSLIQFSFKKITKIYIYSLKNPSVKKINSKFVVILKLLLSYLVNKEVTQITIVFYPYGIAGRTVNIIHGNNSLLEPNLS